MRSAHKPQVFRKSMKSVLIAQAIAAAFVIALPAPAYAEDGDSGVDRSNVSKTPEFASNKAKINVIPAYTQARKADGTAINPINGTCTVTTESGAVQEIGFLDGGKCKVQPLVVSYVDEVEGGEGAQDTFAAVSLDDGATWHRTNLSHTADKPVLVDGVQYGFGDTKKPSMSVNGRKVWVTWTSKLCPSGNPSGFVDGEQGTGYADDIYQVAGSQNVVDYAEAYDRPEFGVMPMSCVVGARGTVDQFGNIIWSKAEQYTSGRRDAYQLTSAVAGKDVGFAAVWQEDPVGLNPGSAAGPGDGMGGAVVSKKTDIWYNFIKGADFLKFETVTSVDEDGNKTTTPYVFPTTYVPLDSNTPPEDPPIGGRPIAAVSFASPVRLTDNAACKVEGEVIYGAPYCKLPQYCASVSEPDENGNQFCITAKGVVLNGDTGASRPNLFLQPYLPNGSTVYMAEAIMGYEETKGLGAGNDAEAVDEDLGKNVVYHHFTDFTNPPVIAAGGILNSPETDEYGEPLLASDGTTYLTRNARRIRFVLQPKSQMGASKTPLVAVWKEGPEGKGAQSDIMFRRAANGYAFENFNGCDDDDGICLEPPMNLSSPTVTASEPISGEPDSDNSAGIKVTQWEWTIDNLSDVPEANPYDDARAHRGVLRGDVLAIGFTWTPNWAAARNGNDVYDYYIRRSFDGGKHWTSMAVKEDKKTNTLVYDTDYGTAEFEQPVNVSNLRMTHSNELTVVEPRIVATPSTILKTVNGVQVPTGNPEDVQNTMVFFTSYGTSSNPDLNLQDDDEDIGVEPQDLYWSWTDNYGESYKLVERQAQGTGETVYEFDWLAKIDGVREGEAQLRMTPAGTQLSAAWLGETEDGGTVGACIPGQDPGSDICYRRITGLDPLDRYDTNGNGMLDAGDALEDFNEDGLVNLVDQKLWDEAYAVWLAQNPQ